jgi:hypothetical protein
MVGRTFRTLSLLSLLCFLILHLWRRSICGSGIRNDQAGPVPEAHIFGDALSLKLDDPRSGVCLECWLFIYGANRLVTANL